MSALDGLPRLRLGALGFCEGFERLRTGAAVGDGCCCCTGGGGGSGGTTAGEVAGEFSGDVVRSAKICCA